MTPNTMLVILLTFHFYLPPLANANLCRFPSWATVSSPHSKRAMAWGRNNSHPGSAAAGIIPNTTVGRLVGWASGISTNNEGWQDIGA